MPKLDHVLFKQVKNHSDQKSFESIYHAYYSALCSYAYGIVKNQEDARDIVNDCFLECWNKRGDIEIKSSLKSYLYISVRNMAINFLSKNKLKQKYLSAQSYPFYLQEEVAAQVEKLQQIEALEERLKNAMDSLPRQCRYIFYLNRYEHMSYKEIAKKMNLSAGTVKTQIARALKRIRADFEDIKAIDQILFLILVRHF
ncbi:RNA polymerase sigma-70 factor [Gaoshiqia sp. Z1-71]|uniref:RNA polymerase sigma-70 factor n=1 Tax=Gaoshiqia hydrogeniformans TaxID=3290090 RepID=UPI003BF854F2